MLIFCLFASLADIFTCCNQVFGSCRTACENVSIGDRGKDGKKGVLVGRIDHISKMRMNAYEWMQRVVQTRAAH